MFIFDRSYVIVNEKIFMKILFIIILLMKSRKLKKILKTLSEKAKWKLF